MTQKDALDILKTGENVYLTGRAGSGKTHVLNQYLSYLHQRKIKVGVTASTGVAATQLNGMTLHAWSGIGTKSTLARNEIHELLKRRYLRKRIENTEVLVIDEVSMLDSKTLSTLDEVCKALKGSSLPFDGMQVVLCGDFFQLPPIQKFEARSTKFEALRQAQGKQIVYGERSRTIPDFDLACRQAGIQDSDFIYKSPVWNSLDLKICYLSRPYRQSEERFVQLLTQIRENAVTPKTWEILKERFLHPITPGMTPTRLFTHNSQADLINKQELSKLKGPEHIFEMTAHGNEVLVEILKNNSLIPEQLVLKERALVMFVKNSFDEGYVNGTMGRVVNFSSEGYPIVETFSGAQVKVRPAKWLIDEGDGEVAYLSQLPLRLAWAITIHKSQGMSLDAAEIDLGKSFVKGMGYVALSRVRTLSGLRLRSINPTALKVNEEVIEFDRELQLESEKTSITLRDQYWSAHQM